jgi:putative endonuclease
LRAVALAEVGGMASTIGYESMHYVYLIRSISSPDKTYVGNTENLIQRLETHNSGGSKYTCNDRPWELVMFLGFADKLKATAFEKYLKSGSGSAFAKKRLW